jgi:hypothetical protein
MGVAKWATQACTIPAWRLPRPRLGSRLPWLVGVCSLANLPSKNTLTTTQQCLSAPGVRHHGGRGTTVATIVDRVRLS